MDDQLLREFLAEVEDLIEALFDDIQSLRADHSEGRARREIIGRIFRRVHTIKGSAAAAEFETIGDIAHEFETLLDSVRTGRVAIDGTVLDVFDDAANALSESLSAVARGEQPALSQTLIKHLRQLACAPPRQTNDYISSVLASLPEEAAQALREPEQHQIREALQEGARLFLINADFYLANFDEHFRHLSEALAKDGEIISTLPGIGTSAPDCISFRIIYAAQETHGDLEKRIAPFQATALSIMDQSSEDMKDAGTLSADEAEIEGTEDAAIHPVTATSPTTLVRVSLDELDQLVAAMHGLFTDIEAALDLILSGEQTRAEQTEREIHAAHIRQRFIELEQSVIRLRMVPVAQTLQRVARAGLIAARVAGKEVDIEITGGEVRLDKSLAETVTNPLLHILRNAVGHGIELPAERQRMGKRARGRIRLEAEAEGSRVLLRVGDDGRGIDPERIAHAAIERGILAPGAHLTKQQALRLIFRPGFSTAASVTSVSGRGVGLDIVERTVEQVGGELRLWSRPGEGTMFEMRFPMPLALVPSLVVHSAGYRYCVDTSHIIGEGYITPSDIEQAGEVQAARWHGEMVPLISLRTLLAQTEVEATGKDDPISVIISHIAGGKTGVKDDRSLERAAVAVDGWDGRREVLVRGLGRYAAHWRGISGATELRDGTVALMLDLPRLLEMHL